jgi:hypothetical protein
MLVKPQKTLLTFLRDFEHLILGWWHDGLRARSSFVGIALARCRVVLVRR